MATPPLPHEPDRAYGFGKVDARPDDDGVAAGKSGGGESAGGPYPRPDADDADGDIAGQSEQGYSGPDNPNATSTRDATRDRAS